MPDNSEASPSILACVTEIVAAHLANNAVPVTSVSALIRDVHATLSELEGQAPAAVGGARPDQQPAVPIDQSVQHEHIVCLEDGKKLRMLKRYLMAQFGMTPEAYRAKWSLPRNYPMVAPAVSEQRRTSAKVTGLGKGAAAAGKRRKG